MSVKDTQLEIMQRKLEQQRTHEERNHLLLKLGFLLTFLLYLLFNQHLYLGDALSWSAYFKDSASIFGFTFSVLIVVLMALFLAWVKHHAYLHFGFFGSVALVVTTVIGFALFAEFFSSSANQDVKASVLLERNSAYQATLKTESSNASINSGLALSIATAEQKLARCEANLKAGKEKHCDGDKAKVEALRISEASMNKANAEADIQRDKLKYERQDELKAESYNPVILTLARALAGVEGDYKDYLKTAVVIIMLFVAVCFEILHHFLSESHGSTIRAIEDLELAIAKYSDTPELVSQSFNHSLPEKQTMGFPISAMAELKPTLFKYQQPEPSRPMGFHAQFNTPNSTLGTHETQLPLPDFGAFKARRDVFASPELVDTDTRNPPCTVHVDTHSTDTQDSDHYTQLKQLIQQGKLEPKVRPIKAILKEWDTGSSDANRQRLASEWLDRLFSEGILRLNPENDGNGIKKAKYILNQYSSKGRARV